MTLLNAVAWLFPSPSDKLGWGLRVRTPAWNQTYLAGEDVEQGRFAIVLINQAMDEQKHVPLEILHKIGNLKVIIVRPDGKTLRARREDIGGNPGKVQLSLACGQFSTSSFTFKHFGYAELPEAGDYELRTSIMTDEGEVFAPALKLKVIEPATDQILESQAVPLEGQFAKRPKEKKDRAMIQQIKIRDQSWLFYRKFSSPELGGGVSAAFRICELPGKVFDLKVEGAFGDGNPLTITYRENSYTKFTTKHVINSTDGRPWTAEEEKHRQERLKKLAPVPEKK